MALVGCFFFSLIEVLLVFKDFFKSWINKVGLFLFLACSLHILFHRGPLKVLFVGPCSTFFLPFAKYCFYPLWSEGRK